ncbi:hypothetical protein [Pollutibacter soli]|uniref:hypothetical protein n=1 Tax=Pollutibacter soli TaxID=3034157 RepID=UPI00301385FE
MKRLLLQISFLVTTGFLLSSPLNIEAKAKATNLVIFNPGIGTDTLPPSIADTTRFLKGRKQMKASKIVLITGGALAISGTILAAYAYSEGTDAQGWTGLVLLVTGLLMMVIAVPISIAGRQNVKKSGISVKAYKESQRSTGNVPGKQPASVGLSLQWNSGSEKKIVNKALF